MSAWLQVRCGAFPLLLPAEHVLDVSRNAAGGDASGHRHWRGINLPLVDLPARLGCAPGARALAVVIGNGQQAQAMCLVDEVPGLCELDDDAIRPVAATGSEFGRWLAGVATAGDGHCRLCLRVPFAWLDEGAAGTGRTHEH